MGHSYQTNFFPPIIFLTHSFIKHLPKKITTVIGICWSGGKQFAVIYFEALMVKVKSFMAASVSIDNIVLLN